MYNFRLIVFLEWIIIELKLVCWNISRTIVLLWFLLYEKYNRNYSIIKIVKIIKISICIFLVAKFTNRIATIRINRTSPPDVCANLGDLQMQPPFHTFRLLLLGCITNEQHVCTPIHSCIFVYQMRAWVRALIRISASFNLHRWHSRAHANNIRFASLHSSANYART